jgi:outer membrane protein assembly factor BamC
MGSEGLDYRSASKAPTKSLEVPPDLTQLQHDGRYAIPGANDGTATASSYQLQQGGRRTENAVLSVAPKSVGDIRVERAGNQRWLVVEKPPEALWQSVRDFWQESGFTLRTVAPEAGVMETEWAENRAKIPQDLVRRTLGKVLDSLYSTGERDKFRTRLERNADGGTEIYISHQGVEEVVTGAQNEGTVWTARPSDPELEAEFLSRLMAHLGKADAAQAKEAVTAAQPRQERARLVESGEGRRLEVAEAFDRAWRRIGLALDRVGFTVEDRDRAQGVYFVRYVDQVKDAQPQAGGKGGLLSRIFSFGSADNKAEAQQYRVSVEGNGATTRVAVLNNEGQAINSATADRILSLLLEQLK